MVDHEHIEEALKELEIFFENYKDWKDGNFVMDKLCQFYSRQTPENQRALNKAFCVWLNSPSYSNRAGGAIWVIKRLGIKENLPVLKQVLMDIENKRSHLEEYHVSFLKMTIEELEQLP